MPGWSSVATTPTTAAPHRLYLTDKATPALEQLGELGEALMARALDGLSPHALETLKQSLERIRSNLKTELQPKTETQTKTELFKTKLVAGV